MNLARVDLRRHVRKVFYPQSLLPAFLPMKTPQNPRVLFLHSLSSSLHCFLYCLRLSFLHVLITQIVYHFITHAPVIVHLVFWIVDVGKVWCEMWFAYLAVSGTWLNQRLRLQLYKILPFRVSSPQSYSPVGQI